MSLEQLGALVIFAVVSTHTPGPNNIMLMASGANFGFRRTIAHGLGITIGFPILIILVGLGLIEIFRIIPPLYAILKVVSLLYILFLAWKIAHSAPPRGGKRGGTAGHPLTFLQAASFQWVNPKAWSMAVAALVAYAGEGALGDVLIVAFVFGGVSLSSTSLWTVLGYEIQKFLTNPKQLVLFNYTMAVSLVGTMVVVIFW